MAKIVTDSYDIDISSLSKKMGLTIKQQRQLQKELSKVDESLKKGQKSGESFLGSLLKFNVIGGLFRAATSAIGGSVKGLVSYNKEMAKLFAITNATREEQKALRITAEELGRTTAYTASEVAQLQQEYAKLGFSVDEINKMSEATVNLAVFTGNTAQTAETAGATLKAFGLQASDSQKLIDLMAASFNKSALDLTKFQESMKLAAPIAKAFGASVEETTALLGTLANVGIAGSLAGTGLRNVFSQLSDESSNVSEVLGGTATNFEELITLLETAKKRGQEFNEDALANLDQRIKGVVINLVNNVDALKNLNGEFENTSGTAKKMADDALDNLAGSFKLLNSAISGLVNDKGSGVYSLLHSVIKESIPTVKWLGENFVAVATVAITSLMIPAVKALWGWVTALTVKVTAATAGLNLLLAAGLAWATSGVLKTLTNDQSDLNKELDSFIEKGDKAAGTFKNLTKEELEYLKKTAEQRNKTIANRGKLSFASGQKEYKKNREAITEIDKQLNDIDEKIRKDNLEKGKKDLASFYKFWISQKKSVIALIGGGEESQNEAISSSMGVPAIEDEGEEEPEDMIFSNEEIETAEQEHNDRLVELEKEKFDRIASIRNKDISDQEKLRKKRIKGEELANAAILSSSVNLFSALGKESKAFFFIGQALRIAEAIMNGSVANTKIAAEWGWNPPVAATLVTANNINTGVAVGTIAAQTVGEFADGVTNLQGAGTARSDSIPARLSKGESVVTAAGTSAGTNASIISGMNNGQSYSNATGQISQLRSDIMGLSAIVANSSQNITVVNEVTRAGLTSQVLKGNGEFNNDNNRTEIESNL